MESENVFNQAIQTRELPRFLPYVAPSVGCFPLWNEDHLKQFFNIHYGYVFDTKHKCWLTSMEDLRRLEEMASAEVPFKPTVAKLAPRYGWVARTIRNYTDDTTSYGTVHACETTGDFQEAMHNIRFAEIGHEKGEELFLSTVQTLQKGLEDNGGGAVTMTIDHPKPTNAKNLKNELIRFHLMDLNDRECQRFFHRMAACGEDEHPCNRPMCYGKYREGRDRHPAHLDPEHQQCPTCVSGQGPRIPASESPLSNGNFSPAPLG